MSKHDKKIFHGNYQPSDESVDDVGTPKVAPIEDLVDAKVCSASESELESGDEAGMQSQNEDVARTPRQQSPLLEKGPFRVKAQIEGGIGAIQTSGWGPFDHLPVFQASRLQAAQ